MKRAFQNARTRHLGGETVKSFAARRSYVDFSRPDLLSDLGERFEANQRRILQSAFSIAGGTDPSATATRTPGRSTSD
jgi:hypothetical protein